MIGDANGSVYLADYNADPSLIVAKNSFQYSSGSINSLLKLTFGG